MQKLKGISSVQNNKSCGIIHHKSNIISLTFFWFFYDFLRNLQESANLFNYLSYPFVIRPLRRLDVLKCGPQGGRPAGLPESGELAAVLGRGRGGGGSLGSRGGCSGAAGGSAGGAARR
jgi:hypothetical protein